MTDDTMTDELQKFSDRINKARYISEISNMPVTLQQIWEGDLIRVDSIMTDQIGLTVRCVLGYHLNEMRKLGFYPSVITAFEGGGKNLAVEFHTKDWFDYDI